MTPCLLLFEINGNTVLADGAQCRVGHFQHDPFAGLRHEEALLEQVRQKAAAGLAVRVRNLVAGYRALSC